MPAELLQKVLRNALVSGTPLKVRWPLKLFGQQGPYRYHNLGGTNGCDPVYVLTVCRRFHELGSQILYSEQVIEFVQDERSHSFPQEFLGRVGKQKAALVRFVTLTACIPSELQSLLEGRDPLLKQSIMTRTHQLMYRKAVKFAHDTHLKLEKQLQCFGAGLMRDLTSCFPNLWVFEVVTIGRPWLPTHAQHSVMLDMLAEGAMRRKGLHSWASWRVPGQDPGRSGLFKQELHYDFDRGLVTFNSRVGPISDFEPWRRDFANRAVGRDSLIRSLEAL